MPHSLNWIKPICAWRYSCWGSEGLERPAASVREVAIAGLSLPAGETLASQAPCWELMGCEGVGALADQDHSKPSPQ